MAVMDTLRAYVDSDRDVLSVLRWAGEQGWSLDRVLRNPQRVVTRWRASLED